MINNYKYDLFISYKRTGVGRYWVPKYFVPCLENELEQCLGREVRIFLDISEIKLGQKWPETIKNALLQSKCLVPVFCGIYFNSEWCSKEFAIFHEREKECNEPTTRLTYDLIIPVLVRDGEHLPEFAKSIQTLSLKDYWTACESFKESPDFMKFEKEIISLAKSISESIKNTPSWRNEWYTDEWFDKIPLDSFKKKEDVTIYENPVLR